MRVSISTVSLLPMLAGCMYSITGLPPGKPVREAYGEEGDPKPAPALHLDQAPAPGAQERTRPVIYPPKVFAVFVPEHLDLERDFKIGAHYVYMKLRDSSWKEEAIDREPFAAAPADPSDLALLKSRLGAAGPARMIVPFEARTPEPAPEEIRGARIPAARGERP